MNSTFELEYPGERTRFRLSLALAILVWLVLIVGTLGIALIYVLMFFIGYLFAQSAFISWLRGSAVRISPEQFPDLHARLQQCAQRLAMAEVPDAYLLHADGLFNALATRFLGRDYIVLFSSVVDALQDEPDAIDFYLGHELGHIRRKHLVWGPVLTIVAWLPLLGAALHRAYEYTCDRHGLAASPSPEAAMQGMAALAAGHSRRTALNLAAFQAQRSEVTGFWASYHELCADYPWLAKRAWALQGLSIGQPARQSGRNPFAYLLALITPRIPGAGGAGLIIMVAIIGVLAAIAVPAYHQYQQRAQMADMLNGLGSGFDSLGADGGSLPEGEVADALRALLQRGFDDAGRQTGAYTAYVQSHQEQPWSFDELLSAQDLRYDGDGAALVVAVDVDYDIEYRIEGGPLDGAMFWMIAAPQYDEQGGLQGVEWSCDASGLPEGFAPQGC